MFMNSYFCKDYTGYLPHGITAINNSGPTAVGIYTECPRATLEALFASPASLYILPAPVDE